MKFVSSFPRRITLQSRHFFINVNEDDLIMDNFNT